MSLRNKVINKLRPFVIRKVGQIRRHRVRLSHKTIFEVLRGFGEFRAPALMVHSSLSRCGQIVGGPRTAIGALRDWIGGEDLVLPTHTYSYPEGDNEAPVYDSRLTVSLVGSLTNYFWREPSVARSIHPTHSLAASGPGAKAICSGHELCDTPCGKGTPYERLIQEDCAVLMFGATMATYTFFHTAEDAAGLPFLYEDRPYDLRYIGTDSHVHMLKMWRQDMTIARRFAEMGTWLEGRGLLVRQKLGRGELLYLPHAAEVHRVVIDELRRDPLFLVGDRSRKALAEKFGLSE